jgi:hypothetical protein
VKNDINIDSDLEGLSEADKSFKNLLLHGSDSGSLCSELDSELSESEDKWKGLSAEPWEESVKKVLSKKAAEADCRAAEHRLDGPIDRSGGAKDKTGQKRGRYTGDSTRSIERQRAEVRKDARGWSGGLENPTIKCRLAALETKQTAKAALKSDQQKTILSFFSTPAQAKAPIASRDQPDLSNNPESDEPEFVEVRTPASPCDEEDQPEPDAVQITAEAEMQEHEAHATRPVDGEAELEEQGKADDKAAAIIEDVLEDAAPANPDEMLAQACVGLQTARKKKDYCSEVLFALLIDLYRWIPKHGRIKASL